MNKCHILGAAAVAASAASSALAVPVRWEANGHYYELVLNDPQDSLAGAMAAAADRTFHGLKGYLATITSADEMAFLDDLTFGPVVKVGWNLVVVGWTSATEFEDSVPRYDWVPYTYPDMGWRPTWLAASDADHEGNWTWIAGPENGEMLDYANWAGGEPNDWGGQEDALIGWVDGTKHWNDALEWGAATAYLVEYGGMEPAVVPVPATVLLLGSALGLLGGLGRRRAT
ncbi:hypothetical protein [Rubellimicrobium arenae]|uniref:hypothetical protein n=1 Tax=Rubellimicrobium arenae TaxID=2817372 RepID=UPI001B3008E0|nr:hypothetical protein [Rubellimicrobium arenae]